MECHVTKMILIINPTNPCKPSAFLCDLRVCVSLKSILMR
jgi:hypothetical protein